MGRHTAGIFEVDVAMGAPPERAPVGREAGFFITKHVDYEILKLWYFNIRIVRDFRTTKKRD